LPDTLCLLANLKNCLVALLQQVLSKNLFKLNFVRITQSAAVV